MIISSAAFLSLFYRIFIANFAMKVYLFLSLTSLFWTT